MAVKFRDYYEVLGVSRTAAQDEIQRAYRKLARKFHPDVNKAADAEDKFKEINEAYEVLKDPEKRKRYDQLGADWKSGQEFRPPPGWDVHFDFGGGAGETQFQWGGAGGFSDFFEMLFGAQGGRGGRRSRDTFSGAGGGGRGPIWSQAGADQEARVRISLEDAFHGATRSITLQQQTINPQGQLAVEEKNYEVKIPRGIATGQKIRLSGQGGPGTGGGARGDLYLKVDIEPHPIYRLEGRDLSVEIPIAPWEAVLGAEVEVPTPDGPVSMKVPPGTSSGQKLRLRGRGMPNPKGAAGDLFVSIQVAVPKNPSKRELELFEELKRISAFAPRS